MSIIKSLSALLIGSQVVSLAYASPLYIWDNQEGLVTSDHCQIESTESTRFRISMFSSTTGKKSNGAETLRSLRGASLSHLINGSLIKIINGKRKKNYMKIEAVGINQKTRLQKNRWVSDRLDQGYLFNQSILPLDRYTIRLAKNTPKAKIGEEKVSLKGTFLKISKENGEYQKVNCSNESNRDYTLFDVYSPNQKSIIAQVGVYWDETKIFQGIETTLTTKSNKRIIMKSKKTARSKKKKQVFQDLSDFDASLPTSRPKKASKKRKKKKKKSTIAGVKVTTGAHQYKVCSSSNYIRVRNQALNRTIFSAKNHEPVTKVNSWATRQKSKTINGKKHNFIRVKFTGREERDQRYGWVSQELISLSSKCKHKVKKVRKKVRLGRIKSITDKKCCIFPVQGRPLVSYVTHSVARFGAARAGGRTHAATDLYRRKNESVVSVAPGKVIVGLKIFYFNSYQMAVKHTGGHVIRYGEVTGRRVPRTGYGARVRAGQKLGYVQQIRTKKGNRLPPMLHFEMFRGNVSGNKLNGGRFLKRNKAYGRKAGKYIRRRDLMNPTKYVRRWERKRFGKSW